jgi:hypothetical protein
MKNLVRIVTATLLLAACISAAAPAPPISTTLSQEGPSPVPLCDPQNPKCQMPAAPGSSSQR